MHFNDSSSNFGTSELTYLISSIFPEFSSSSSSSSSTTTPIALNNKKKEIYTF
jgi:hypothetical protein